MSGIGRFFKSTLIGGLVILVPMVVLLAILVWVVDLALKVILPVFEWLPNKSVGGVSLAVLAALASIIVGCFVAGLVAETALIRGLSQRAEQLALFMPGYALMKNVGAKLIGIEMKRPVQTVLVQFPASWQLGFLMETLTDGRHVVFVPGVPRALVGELHIVLPGNIQFLTMSVSHALDALSRLGVGLTDIAVKEPASIGDGHS